MVGTRQGIVDKSILPLPGLYTFCGFRLTSTRHVLWLVTQPGSCITELSKSFNIFKGPSEASLEKGRSCEEQTAFWTDCVPSSGIISHEVSGAGEKHI
ncbi:unnamed protein product [Caretta caretta]